MLAPDALRSIVGLTTPQIRGHDETIVRVVDAGFGQQGVIEGGAGRETNAGLQLLVDDLVD